MFDIVYVWISLGFWICQSSEYTEVLTEYTTVLNMFLILNVSGLWIYHVSKYARVKQGFEYARIILGFAWSCLNVPKYVWMAFVLHFLIVIPYLKKPYTIFLESEFFFCL